MAGPSIGTLYGIGVGPGDPDLITVKGARILGMVKRVFAPKSWTRGPSLALEIARNHIHNRAQIHEIEFPIHGNEVELKQRWSDQARMVAGYLRQGEDCCYITLGDTSLYSTFIYLAQAMEEVAPEVPILSVPGITAFSAVAAAAEFPVGQGKSQVTILPSADDLGALKEALKHDGELVIMKVGRRLRAILELLDDTGHIDNAVFFSRVGLDGARMETDLRRLLSEGSQTGGLSTILVSLSGSWKK